MRGLVDGGPTRSGHRTPAVIVSLAHRRDRRAISARERVDDQAGARGWRSRAAAVSRREPGGGARVRRSRTLLVQPSRGLRSRRRAARTRRPEPRSRDLGNSRRRVLRPSRSLAAQSARRAAAGDQSRDTRALADVERTTRVPGLAFTEWGPGDMGMSMGYPDQHDEPSYPPQMQAAANPDHGSVQGCRPGFPRAGHAGECDEPACRGCDDRMRPAGTRGGGDRRRTGRTQAW